MKKCSECRAAPIYTSDRFSSPPDPASTTDDIYDFSETLSKRTPGGLARTRICMSDRLCWRLFCISALGDMMLKDKRLKVECVTFREVSAGMKWNGKCI